MTAQNARGWTLVTDDSPLHDRGLVWDLMARHLNAGHGLFTCAAWILANGDGIALVAPSVPLWHKEELTSRTLASLAEPSEMEHWMLTLTTCWIAPKHRRQGHFRALLRVLREHYTTNLTVNSTLLEAAGWIK